MDVAPVSTVAALCYARKTGVDFHDLAVDLSKAMSAGQGGMRLEMPRDGFALCDMPGLQITVARAQMWHEFPGTPAARHYPECILLSVGPGDAANSDVLEIVRFDQVRDALILLAQDAAAADRVLLFEGPAVYDAEANDEMVDALRAHLDETLAAGAAPRRAAGDANPASGRRTAESPGAGHGAARAAKSTASNRPAAQIRIDAAGTARVVDAPRADVVAADLTARVEAELARLESARAAYEAAAAAAARRTSGPQGFRLTLPRLFPATARSPLALFMNAATARKAPADYPDYEHMPDNIDERPLLHRAAVNALNATVLVFALPVGVALLTMSVLGREDMLFSSRVTAVTGTMIGLSKTGFGEKLLSLFS